MDANALYLCKCLEHTHTHTHTHPHNVYFLIRFQDLFYNVRFLGCTGQAMPCGMFLRRRVEENFTKEYPNPTSSTATACLANLEHNLGIEIQHLRNRPEYRVGPKQIRVDGYCE